MRLVEEGRSRAELEHQEWEARQERWRQEEDVRRAVQAHEDSLKDLLHAIAEMGTGEMHREFFRGA